MVRMILGLFSVLLIAFVGWVFIIQPLFDKTAVVEEQKAKELQPIPFAKAVNFNTSNVLSS